MARPKNSLQAYNWQHNRTLCQRQIGGYVHKRSAYASGSRKFSQDWIESAQMISVEAVEMTRKLVLNYCIHVWHFVVGESDIQVIIRIWMVCHALILTV